MALPAAHLTPRNCLAGWAPAALALPLGSVFPRETTLTAATLGVVGWVTFPGELQTSLGREIKNTGRGGLRHALVAGVSNDYLGYFLTAADYGRPSYGIYSRLYGPRAGGCLAEAAGALLARVARGETSPATRVVCDR